MKLKALFIAAVFSVAFVSVGVATAKKPPATGTGCKPAVALIVVGKATADASATQVSLNVSGGNRFARVLFKNGTTTALTVTASSTTKITTASGGSPTALTAVKSGQRVLVKYKVCKADLKGATAASLSALLTKLTPTKIVKLG